MIRNFVLMVCVLCAAILIGCSKTETGNSNTAAENSNKGTTAATTPSNAASASDKIGVPECDDFIAKYDACVASKVPEIARSQYQTALKQWRADWKKAAENPKTRETLVSICKDAAEKQGAALKSFGCTW